MTTETLPHPELTDTNKPFWEGLKKGVLSYQHCKVCNHSWLPARSECPNCLEVDWKWTPATGRARLISWVVYHVAYHPAVAKKLPYNVAVVELDEGARLITNITGVQDMESLRIEQALVLSIEEEDGWSLPRFKVVSY